MGKVQEVWKTRQDLESMLKTLEIILTIIKNPEGI